MKLSKLKYFKAVCEHQSISAAAESLFISQPSVSSAIKELETEFKITLFKRHHHGIVLTNEGHEFLKLAESLLSYAEQTERVMNTLGEINKTLSLGIPPMIGSLFLPHIYREFIAVNKDIKLDIFEGGRQELLNKLSENLLDMVFLPHTTPFDAEFNSYKIAKLEIVGCVHKNNPLAKLKNITPENLRNIPLVLFKNSFFQTEKIKKWFTDAGIEPEILLQTDQLSTLLNMISNNIATGFLFRQSLINSQNLIALPAKEPMYIDVSLVINKNSQILTSAKTFINYITESDTIKIISL